MLPSILSLSDAVKIDHVAPTRLLEDGHEANADQFFVIGLMEARYQLTSINANF
jgi:hypothetical protein